MTTLVRDISPYCVVAPSVSTIQTTVEREPSVPPPPELLLGYWKSLLEVSTSKFEFCNFIGFSINVIPVSPRPLRTPGGTSPLLNLLGLPNSSEKVKPRREEQRPTLSWP